MTAHVAMLCSSDRTSLTNHIYRNSQLVRKYEEAAAAWRTCALSEGLWSSNTDTFSPFLHGHEHDEEFGAEHSSVGAEDDSDDELFKPWNKARRHRRKHAEVMLPKQGFATRPVVTVHPDDPDLPGRPPRNAYMMYMNDNFKKIKTDNPSLSVVGVGKVTAEQWKSLTYEERQKYESEFRHQVRDYEKKLADYYASKAEAAKEELIEKHARSESAQSSSSSTGSGESPVNKSSSIPNGTSLTPRRRPNSISSDLEDQETEIDDRECDGLDCNNDDLSVEELDGRSISPVAIIKSLPPPSPTARCDRGTPTHEKWYLPIIGTPTSYGLTPFRKRKVRRLDDERPMTL
jgi:hypothetical protein